jgi:hypothetical protein
VPNPHTAAVGGSAEGASKAPGASSAGRRLRAYTSFVGPTFTPMRRQRLPRTNRLPSLTHLVLHSSV